MIYISIDNDYHTNLATALIKQCNVKSEEVMFISHYSPRNNISLLSYNKIETAGHPLSDGSGYNHPLSYLKSIIHQFKLSRSFNFTSKDILIVITEYQLNNAILAKKMKSAGGRVFLFDEGIGFYFNNSPYHHAYTKLLDKFYLFFYNLSFYFLIIPAYAKKGQEGKMFVCIKDTLIECMYSRLNLPIERKISIHGYQSQLNLAVDSKKFNNDTVIFFASNFECFNLKAEEMHLAALAIDQMASVFSKVYIKIHPSDYIKKNETFNFYSSINYHNVEIIDNSLSSIQAINKYSPSVVVGAMSTSLIDALLLGCQPIFLFHLLPDIKEFGVYKFTLDNLGYKFVSLISDISPDYQCNVDITNLTYQNYDLNIFINEIDNFQSTRSAKGN